MNSDTKFSFPVKSTLKKTDIEQQFIKCLYNSTDQKVLHYWVILPKRLKAAELSPVNFPDSRLTNIGRYITADDSSYLEIWAAYEHCKWEMNPSDWLLNRLAAMGEEILNQRIFVKTGGGNLIDVLTKKVYPSGEVVISRFTVHKDYDPKHGGGNYFMMKASCDSRDYESLADEMLVVVTNWNLSHRSNLLTAEQLKTIYINEKSSFKIPDSWKANIIADNRLIIEHIEDDSSNGIINYYFYPSDLFNSPNDVFYFSTERFRNSESSIKLTSDEIEIIPNEINESSGSVFYVCTGQVSSEQHNMHAFFQMIIFKQKGLWCYVEQIGKFRDFESYFFEANKRCLELIVATVKL